MNLERLYLDYNATSPLSESVKNWLRSGDLLFANPSSQHSSGKASRKLINQCRQDLYNTFNKTEKEHQLFYNSGATEAFHTFAYSFSEMARREGKELLICYSKIDHPAVTGLKELNFGPHVRFFELKRGQNLEYLYDENITLLRAQKESGSGLIILYHHLWVHNETGLVSPLEDLLRLKAIPDLYVHVDAVQAPGKLLEWRALSEGDVWSFSAHKFGAMKGIGFSFYKRSLPFYPLFKGGGQQGNLRGGTENGLGVKSISLALQDLDSVCVENTINLRRRLVSFMTKELEGLGGIICSERAASNTIYFYFNELQSDVAMALFDIHGLEISAGSACSSGSARPSTVLTFMGLSKVAKNGLRLSLPLSLSEDDLNIIEERMRRIFEKLRK